MIFIVISCLYSVLYVSDVPADGRELTENVGKIAVSKQRDT
jgi:hypothetical protein